MPLVSNDTITHNIAWHLSAVNSKDPKGSATAPVTLTYKIAKTHMAVVSPARRNAHVMLGGTNRYGGSTSLDEMFHKEFYCY